MFNAVYHAEYYAQKTRYSIIGLRRNHLQTTRKCVLYFVVSYAFGYINGHV